MADLLIRNLEPTVIQRLKQLAKQHHRSLQGELKYIVEKATKLSLKDAKAISQKWHKQLSDGAFSDSTELLRRDRDR
jgi:hypothetical protein